MMPDAGVGPGVTDATVAVDGLADGVSALVAG
jgi:hypothetical protein